jgi:hypothetical protein
MRPPGAERAATVLADMGIGTTFSLEIVPPAALGLNGN